MDDGCPYKVAAETFKIAERYTPQAENCYEMDQKHPLSNQQTPPAHEHKPPRREITHEKTSELIGQK